MFGLGAPELLVIAVIALLITFPTALGSITRGVGWFASISPSLVSAIWFSPIIPAP